METIIFSKKCTEKFLNCAKISKSVFQKFFDFYTVLIVQKLQRVYIFVKIILRNYLCITWLPESQNKQKVEKMKLFWILSDCLLDTPGCNLFFIF